MASGFTTTWRVTYTRLPQVITNLATVDAIVAKAAADIEAGAKVRAPVDTGTLRNSIQASMVGVAHWRVTVGADYGVHVEWGTVHMAAQPFLRPAVTEVRPQFLYAMRKAVTAA